MKLTGLIHRIGFGFLGIIFACLINSDNIYAEWQPPYEDGELIVVFEEDVSKEEAEEILQTDAGQSDAAKTGNDDEAFELTAEAETGITYSVVNLNQISENTIPSDVMDAVDYYNDLPGVAFAQPNYIYEIEEPEMYAEASETVVNDAFVAKQWYWDYLEMNRTRALLKKAGAQKIRVAVIDTGVDVTHPDLSGSLNLAYSVNTCSETYTAVTTDNGSTSHGTMVAGIIGAKADNGIGVAGIASDYAEICALQVQNQGGSITTSNVIRALQYARGINAKIVNMSMGMYVEDLALKEALKTTNDAGILIVCSAGNNGTDAAHYPSGYDSTIGVIATDQNGQKYNSSNYGTDNFISAPGVSIYSTSKNGQYASANGSSMASAVLCGVAADIWACNPAMTASDVKNILASTATDTYTAGFDAYSGWGIVNALSAISKTTGLSDTNEDTFEELPNTTEGFVERLYRYCLNRSSDEEGMRTWCGVLNNKTKNGAEVAYGFLFSDEFIEKNLSDEEYVDILYRTFLNRNADAAGKVDWLRALSEGMSRLYVMNGFSGSNEFKEICNNCGFSAGQIPVRENRDKNQGYTAFVTRLYQQALGRDYDIPGLNNWTGLLNDRKWNAYRVATEGFFHSPEFLNMRLNNEEFVKVLYRTFLGREYDERGLRDWINALNSGKSRDEVIAGFANSKEFREIMASYGL